MCRPSRFKNTIQTGGNVLKPATPRRSMRVFVLVLAVALFAASCGGSSKNSNASGSSGGTASTAAKPTPGGSITYGQDAESAGGLCLPEAQLAISGINYARAVYDTLTAPDEN